MAAAVVHMQRERESDLQGNQSRCKLGFVSRGFGHIWMRLRSLCVSAVKQYPLNLRSRVLQSDCREECSSLSVLPLPKIWFIFFMEPLPTEDLAGKAASSNVNTAPKPLSYAEKLLSNSLPPEVVARSAKKAFVPSVDSKVIGTSALFNGRKTIFLSKEDDDFMVAPFQYALIGKFSHGYPSMQRLRSKFETLGLNKGFKIGILDHKHVWIRLFDPNDYARIWMKQTWYFDGFPMRVLKWTSEFNPNEESPIMPIWIKIFGLRPHWFHRQFLYHVASMIGKPVKLDEATTDIANPMVARICVELNVLDKLQPDIPIQINGKMIFLKVQYEGIPQYCKICRHRGHSMAACFLREENTGDNNDMQNTVEHQVDLRTVLQKKRGNQPEIGPQHKDADGLQDNEKPNDINDQDVMLSSTKRDYLTANERQSQNSHQEENNSETMVRNTEDNFVNLESNETRMVDIQGQKYKVLVSDPNTSKRNTNESPKGNSIRESGYPEEIRRQRELELVVSSPTANEGNHVDDFTLGHDIRVSDNGGIDIDSEQTESVEQWQEVTSRKHRRTTSLDEQPRILNVEEDDDLEAVSVKMRPMFCCWCVLFKWAI
ncbi:hypothetical protein BUALT_Bualt05G0055800 [Buddleja alternifolia]|uniref:DUF4283 domain-containing protein n=1 Tax=Buddleja alternifolia TaxID=168488 RepID=A0AAV6XL78_9LAMI|nr:hypothetical protein BUALT_Bualt05G0055800 [Buddleja alternifolia]